MKFGIVALSLLVVATSIPLAVADQAVCTPGNEACLRTRNTVAGTGTCTTGSYYYEYHGASLAANAGTQSAALTAYNACYHRTFWGITTEYSVVGAQLSTFDSSTWDYDAVGVAWYDSNRGGCDTYVFVNSVEGAPANGKVASLGCPTGDGPGIIFPALP